MEKLARRVYDDIKGKKKYEIIGIWLGILRQEIHENQDKINEIIEWINNPKKQLDKIYNQTLRNEAKIKWIQNWIDERERYTEPLEKAWRQAWKQILEQVKDRKNEESNR